MAQEPQGKFFDRVKSLDLYALLEVEPDVDEKVLKKAYRKKALTCHPDKNPGNKAAVELFHQLSDALEVLSDEKTRAAYDNLLKARKAAELRNKQLDGKRRKLKEQLEERERSSKTEEEVVRVTEEEKLAREIERLRREGSRLLEEEQEAMQQQIREEKLQSSNGGSRCRTGQAEGVSRVKVKWDRRSGCQYSREQLQQIFSKYGNITGVVLSDKKGGSALVEFEDLKAAKMAVTIETGFSENKLRIKPLWEEEKKADEGVGDSSVGGSDNSGVNRDFESLVMRKLRQEEERKRLIKQMMEEEG